MKISFRILPLALPAAILAGSPATTFAAGGFYALPPCRVVDTRGATGVPLGGPALVAGEARNLKVRRLCGIPDNASAVSFNLTVTAPTNAGNLRIYPGGSAAPLASVINYGAGQTRANNGVVPLGPDGSIAVQCDQASGRVDLILDVNGYLATTDDAPTAAGPMSRVRPVPEVELTFDTVATPGVTTAQVLDFVDNRGAAVSQSLKDFFPVGSPERALVPDVIVPDYLVPLGQGGPTGTPTFLLSIVNTTATFARTAEFHGLEEFRLGWHPPCVVTSDPTQEPRTFYARLPGQPALEEDTLFGGNPAFVNISSGCGSNKGSGWNFSVYLTARDTRTPLQIGQFMLDRMQGALTSLAAFIVNPTVASNLSAAVNAAITNFASAPALAMANMADFIGIVDANPAAFDNSVRNVRGELTGRAQSASYMARKRVPPGSMVEFTIPTADSKPLGITLGPDGNLWFTAGDTPVGGGNNIGRITRAGVITEFPIPTPNSRPYSISAGPDGNVWFTEAGKIGRITPAGVITEFPVAGAPGLFGLVSGPDGNLWFTQFNTGEIGRINPTTGAITKFPVVSALDGINGLAVGPDGNLWFTMYVRHRIGSVTTTGVLVATYPTPTANSFPEGITAGPDGNLWFTERVGNRIGRITPSGVITEFSFPTPGSPSWLTAGPDGNLWYTQFGGTRIGRITPAGVVTEFVTPTSSSFPYNIAVGPDGNLWFTEYGTNKIGRVTP